MGNPYYEDEYEDYDDYEDYCSGCGQHFVWCCCPSEIEEHCDCGAVIDEHGNCPYCDYAADVTDSKVAASDVGSVTEQWSWFENMNIYYGNEGKE